MQFSQVFFADLFIFSRANLEFSRDFHGFLVKCSKMASNIGWSLDLLLGGYIARQRAVREGRMGRGFSPRGDQSRRQRTALANPFPPFLSSFTSLDYFPVALLVCVSRSFGATRSRERSVGRGPTNR